MRNTILITTAGLIALVFVVGALAATEISDTAQTAQTSIPSDKDENFNTEEKQKLVTDAINKYREEHGVFRIKENLFVTLPAGKFTRSLVEDSHWGTSTADGKEYSEFIKESGYNANEMGLAMSRGYTDMNQILESWRTNKDTNDTLLDSKFTNVGVYWDKYESGEDILIVFFADTPKNINNAPTTSTQKTTTQTSTTAAKYDGSRTGRIIKYTTFCTGETISIYENELMKFQPSGQEPSYMTKGDIDCYNQKLKDIYKENQTTYEYEPYNFDSSKYSLYPTSGPSPTSKIYPTPTMTDEQVLSIIDSLYRDYDNCLTDIYYYETDKKLECIGYSGNLSYMEHCYEEMNNTIASMRSYCESINPDNY